MYETELPRTGPVRPGSPLVRPRAYAEAPRSRFFARRAAAPCLLLLELGQVLKWNVLRTHNGFGRQERLQGNTWNSQHAGRRTH